MASYTVHTYVTVRIPVSLEATSPRDAAIKGREEALRLARAGRFGQGEYAEDYESGVVVDKLDSKFNVVRSWDIDPTPNKESGA